MVNNFLSLTKSYCYLSVIIATNCDISILFNSNVFTKTKHAQNH